MKKIYLLTIISLILSMSNSYLYAGYDCNTIRPTVYLTGNCTKEPWYYTVSINAESLWEKRRKSDGQLVDSYDRTGSSTEYLTDLGSCEPVECKDPEYSDSNNPDNMAVNFAISAPCYHSIGSCPGCHYADNNSCDLSGAWSTGGGLSYECNDEHVHDSEDNYYTFHSESSTTVTISPEYTPASCQEPDGTVTIDDFEKQMFVRGKGGCCDMKPSGAQTITVSCSGARHTKVSCSVSGNNKLIVEPMSYSKGCWEGDHSAGGSVTIIPNHGVDLKKGEGKTATVSYSIEFYDKAGNSINSETITVTLKAKCPPYEAK